MSSSRSDAAHSKSSPPGSSKSDVLPASSERVLHVLRMAQDEVERKVAGELQRANSAQQATRRELEEARTRNAELQKELDKMVTQKNYVADAFETSRKETAKLRTENQLANEELVRLRRAVEELSAERTAAGIGKKVIDTELSALEVERDVISRALGAATKQLFGKLGQQQQQEGNAAAAKPRPPSVKKVSRPPAAKALGTMSPKVLNSPGRASSAGSVASQPTGNGRAGAQRGAAGGGGRGLPW